ncbi:unnamed protein product [Paramecium octaurelia]|uniref:Uncharacterized protein n=1 Tax=Paramecium octaurelia TaxID=43137 RepID=A0A8S1XQ64_PAROT|nr:unnamed protein product [Paramecium octaurelia]
MEESTQAMRSKIQSSFNRIEDSIDGIQDCFKTIHPLQSKEPTIHKFNKPCWPEVHNEQFSNQLSQKVTKSVSLNICNQLKKQEEIQLKNKKLISLI